MIQSWGAKDQEGLRAHVEAELKNSFRPEFLNRLDEVVLFNPLGHEELRQVVDIQASRLVRLMRDRGITLEITPRLRDHLAEVGYDPEYGARPLKRTLQRLVLDPLARQILEGRFGPGQAVRADRDETADRVRFETVTPPAPPTETEPAGAGA